MLQAISNGDIAFSKEFHFNVIVPANVNENREVLDSIEVPKLCNIGGGAITATINLNKTGFIPGEQIEGTISIKNNSKESIKTDFLRIVQETKVLSRNLEKILISSTVETPGVSCLANKIPPGKGHTYPIKYFVPTIIPNFEIPGFLKVNYDLVLTVGRNRDDVKDGFLDSKVRIVIGTFAD